MLFNKVKEDFTLLDRHLPYIAMVKAYLDKNNKLAMELLNEIPYPAQVEDLVELAVLKKRANDFKGAHSIFSEHYDYIKDSPKALHEYAQTKIKLARSLRGGLISKRLYKEAVELLHRAIQLSDDNVRNAWCWFDLARSLSSLQSPDEDVIKAYQTAIELLPYESHFKENYETWKRRRAR